MNRSVTSASRSRIDTAPMMPPRPCPSVLALLLRIVRATKVGDQLLVQPASGLQNKLR